MSASSPGSTPVYRPPGRPRSAADAEILATADALFRAGTWPSADALLARLGRGSKSTIHRVQREWRDALPRRFASQGSAALERLPEPVIHVAEALWIRAQEEARATVHGVDAQAREAVRSERDSIELQRHVLSLREQEMQRQLQERQRVAEALQQQAREQTLLLRKMQASRDADARHIRELQAQLASLLERRRAKARPKPRPKSRRSPKKPRPVARRQKGTGTRRRVTRKPPPAPRTRP